MIITKLTFTTIDAWGSFTICIDQQARTIDMSKQENQDFFLSCLTASRKAEKETELLESIKDGSFFAELPSELKALEDHYTTISKVRGKYQIECRYDAGNLHLQGLTDNIKDLKDWDIDKMDTVFDGFMPSSIVYTLKPTQQQ